MRAFNSLVIYYSISYVYSLRLTAFNGPIRAFKRL